MPNTGAPAAAVVRHTVADLLSDTGKMRVVTAELAAKLKASTEEVNDQYGYLLGDKVLHTVAHVLKSSIQGRDVAARVGGEEFALLLFQTSSSSAIALARQICSLVSQPTTRS
jgi:diguanylate cyclase (GGDEF)-like protein